MDSLNTNFHLSKEFHLTEYNFQIVLLRKTLNSSTPKAFFFSWANTVFCLVFPHCKGTSDIKGTVYIRIKAFIQRYTSRGSKGEMCGRHGNAFYCLYLLYQAFQYLYVLIHCQHQREQVRSLLGLYWYEVFYLFSLNQVKQQLNF